MTSRIEHGGFTRVSKYDLVQHRYGYTDCESEKQGYAEVLEIRDPPTGKCGVVLHVYWNETGSFWGEFSTLPEAINAWETACRLRFPTINDIDGLPGCLKTDESGHLDPWFYAL